MTDPAENIQVQRLKWLLLISSLVSIGFMLLAAFEENLIGEWREHQKAYRQTLVDRAADDAARAAAGAMPIGFKQSYLPQLDRIDRCVTCHIGVDDPKQFDAEQPLRTHSGDVLAQHPVDKFGCTVCHDGQPLATQKDAAHGDVKHWPQPLLRGERVYTSCSRCHYENDLYGAEDDLYSGGGSLTPLTAHELDAAVPGAASIARGKQLVLESGCLGCHAYRGRGGTLGPDITYIGDKDKHGFDFKHITGEHTPEQWLIEHFKEPQKVSPGSLMPDMGVTDEQAHDLAHFMMSLHHKNMPAAYTPVPKRPAIGEHQPATGAQLYGMYCSSCHGPAGRGSTVRELNTPQAIDAPAQLMVPSINHPDTLAVASNDYLRYVVAHGRPETNMIAWSGDRGGGLGPQEIDRIIDFIRSWDEQGADLAQVSADRGDARVGKSMYRANCAGCHGENGQGGIGPSLNSTTFLAVASDRYLAQTIVEGRPNTAMSGYRFFDAQQISDMLAHLRSWHPKLSDRKQTLALAAKDDDANVSAAIGRTLFASHCVMCHGSEGQGDLGPSLNTDEFLTLVDDDYLYDAIVFGRPDTPMPAWRHLSSADTASLIKYIRTWQRGKHRALPPARVVADPEIGRIIYERACMSCHGKEAEGALGTQLRNPVFLRSATNAMLREWIAYGKGSTQMLGFLKGQQGPVDLSAGQIDDVVAYIRSLEFQPSTSAARNPNGQPDLGEMWYANACASCHGEYGEGASGPSLSNPALLRAVNDGFLLATLALGRDGTEMRPVKKGPQSILSLSSDQVNDIVTFIRSWEAEPPIEGIPHNFVIPWDLARGKRLYESNCAGCHGVNGKAEIKDPKLSAWAPQLNNTGFLKAATDGFLQATIVRGRTGTAMRPFGRGSHGLVDLSMQEIDDIVAYIRRWANDPASPMTIPAEISFEPEPIAHAGATGE